MIGSSRLAAVAATIPPLLVSQVDADPPFSASTDWLAGEWYVEYDKVTNWVTLTQRGLNVATNCEAVT